MNKRQTVRKTRTVRPVIRYSTNFHNVITSVMRHRPGWVNGREEDEKKIDFFWAETMWMHEQFDNIYFSEHVKVNHFPRFYELTRKNLLAKNLKRFQKMMGRFRKYIVFRQTSTQDRFSLKLFHGFWLESELIKTGFR